MLKEVLVVAAVAAAIGLSYFQTYRLGSLNGAAAVQADWNRQKNERQSEIDRLTGELNLAVKLHQVKEKELADALWENNLEAESRIADVHAEYAVRLQHAENRAGVYERKARGTEAERKDLARHAAELDRSLEEGRALVGELWETVRQREVTIRALGGVILNDRSLLEVKND